VRQRTSIRITLRSEPNPQAAFLVPSNTSPEAF
jgi:hypothetical protein